MKKSLGEYLFILFIITIIVAMPINFIYTMMKNPPNGIEIFVFVICGIFFLIPWLEGIGTTKKKKTTKRKTRRKKKTKDPYPFNENELLEKAETAFVKYYTALIEHDISPLPRYTSDGMYRRIQTEFDFLRKAGQRFDIEGIRLNNHFVERYVQEDGYESVDIAMNVRVTARREKQNSILQKFGEKDEPFTEYWSFIRQGDHYDGDIYHSTKCPNCGKELKKFKTQTAHCNHCDSKLNSGHYDWILTNITSEELWNRVGAQGRITELKRKQKRLTQELPYFALFDIEDKVSSAAMQIMWAQSQGKPELIQRFVSDKLFTFLKDTTEYDNYLYRNFQQNGVILEEIQEQKDRFRIYVRVMLSYQRFAKGKLGIAKRVDNALEENETVYVLDRLKNDFTPRGNLFMERCSCCGAGIKSNDVTCEYCGKKLNDPANEWIITEILSQEQFAAIRLELKMEIYPKW